MARGKRTYGTGQLYEKHGSWYGKWHAPDGARRNRKVGAIQQGRRPGLNKTEAGKRLQEMIAADTGAKIETDGTSKTVTELGENLIDRLRLGNRKASHIETAEYHLRAHINKSALGKLPAERVTEDDVQAFIYSLARKKTAQGRPLSPKTIRNVLGTLHSTLAIERKADNPCDMAEGPKYRRSKKIRYLTIEELERVGAAEPGDDDAAIIASFPADPKKKWGGPQAARTWWPVVRLLILVAATSGMRLAELRGLRWRDLDLLAMRFHITETFVRGQFVLPKSDGSSRSVPLFDQTFEELDAYHKISPYNREDDLVFAHPLTGRPLDRVRLLLHVQAACRRAGVRGDLRVHDLRHTFGTQMAASGTPMKKLQAFMGHANQATTDLYSDYQLQPHDNELVNAAFQGLGAGRRVPNGSQMSPTTTNNNPPQPIRTQ